MSLSIPNFPTDNLYKFMALSGLFIATFCFGTLTYSLIQTENQIDLTRVQSEHVDDMLEDLKSGFDTKEFDAQNQRKRFDYYQKQYNELHKQIALLHDDVFMIKNRVLLRGTIIGILISFFGFLLWFFRVQIHLDRIVKINIKKLEAELETAQLELRNRKKLEHDPTP
ncbi:MAG: hypothetical protein ACSHXY_13580 [Alphaproteobacteria bacterium]